MAFCTECGFKLPDDAIFCPNCGSSVAGAVHTDKEMASVSLEKDSGEDSAPANNALATGSDMPVAFSGSYGDEFQERTAAQPAYIYAASSQNTVSPSPAQEEYSDTVRGSYVPHEQGNCSPPFHGTYAQQDQFSPPAGFGYSGQGAFAAPATAKNKTSGGKIAAIVISSVVLLIALAGYLIHRASSGGSYIGYWESAAVDDGSGTLSYEYLGENVSGLLGIQINKDGTALMCSAFNSEIYDGDWTKTEYGIEVDDDGDIYTFVFKDKKLYLSNDEGMYIVFEKSRGDINHPSIPHGSLSGNNGDSGVQFGNTAGSGYVGHDKFYIEIIGAEGFTDVDGEPAIRVYFNFTNKFGYPVDAWNSLDIRASQDGNELVEAYAWETVGAVGNLHYKIRPGISIQCAYEFKYNPNGGGVELSVLSWDEGYDGGTVKATYVPDNLPGAPAPYVIKPVSDPTWTANIPGEGTLDDYYYVSVLDAELLSDLNGNPAIRVYYDFTNNSSSYISLGEALFAYTYQDGISLDVSYAPQEIDTDVNFDTQIAPGTTIRASRVFSLRNSTSPIEAEIEAYNTYDAVGQTYKIY